MADDDDTQGQDDTGGEDKPKGQAFRKKYEEAMAENARLKGQVMIHDAGLGHLSEKQRKAVVNDASEGGVELTAELLKASAKDLGYSTEAPKPQGQGEGDNEGQGQEGEEGADEDPTPGSTGMELIDRIMQRPTTANQPGDFGDKINKAQSAEEVTALIRSEGAKVGLVHEWDID